MLIYFLTIIISFFHFTNTLNRNTSDSFYLLSSTNTSNNNILLKLSLTIIERYKHDIYIRDEFESIAIGSFSEVVKRIRKNGCGVGELG